MAMTTKYNVFAYHAIKGPAEQQAKRLSGSFDRIARTAKRVAGILATGWIAHRLGRATMEAIGFNKQLESMRIGMGASMLSAQIFDDIGAAADRAAPMLKKLERAAVISPGTFSQFANLANMIMPYVSQASTGVRDLEEKIISLSTKGISAGAGSYHQDLIVVDISGQYPRAADTAISPGTQRYE